MIWMSLSFQFIQAYSVYTAAIDKGHDMGENNCLACTIEIFQMLWSLRVRTTLYGYGKVGVNYETVQS